MAPCEVPLRTISAVVAKSSTIQTIRVESTSLCNLFYLHLFIYTAAALMVFSLPKVQTVGSHGDLTSSLGSVGGFYSQIFIYLYLSTCFHRVATFILFLTYILHYIDKYTVLPNILFYFIRNKNIRVSRTYVVRRVQTYNVTF